MRAGDLSCEAAGILVFLQDRKNIILLHALQSILLPIYRFSTQLQSPKLSLVSVPETYDGVRLSLQTILETPSVYVDEANKTIQSGQLAILDSSQMSDSNIHKSIVEPYVTKLLNNLEKRFSGLLMNICSATAIFDPLNATSDSSYGDQAIETLASSLRQLNASELANEWTSFKNLLRAHNKRGERGAQAILQKLASQQSDLADAYPQLSILAKTILVCPIGTAGVERSFSCMARVCTRLRNRMSTETISACLLVSLEGPEKLSKAEASEVVQYWHRRDKNRRILI